MNYLFATPREEDDGYKLDDIWMTHSVRGLALGVPGCMGKCMAGLGTMNYVV